MRGVDTANTFEVRPAKCVTSGPDETLIQFKPFQNQRPKLLSLADAKNLCAWLQQTILELDPQAGADLEAIAEAIRK